MICTKHDSHLELARTQWADAKCDDPDCVMCSTRPDRPRECPEGPCESCKYLDTYLGNKKLKGIVRLINRHRVARDLITARLLKSKKDRQKKRIVVTCNFTNEVIMEIDGGRESTDPRNAGDRGILPTVRAACWWVDYLEDLPEDDLAKPSRRAQEEALKLELSGHWQEKNKLWKLPSPKPQTTPTRRWSPLRQDAGS